MMSAIGDGHIRQIAAKLSVKKCERYSDTDIVKKIITIL